MSTSPKDASFVQTQRSSGDDSNAVVSREKLTSHLPIDRNELIAKIAYACAERRGFAPGHELEDWLDAEKQAEFEIVGEGRTF